MQNKFKGVDMSTNATLTNLKARLESEKNKTADENWNTHSGKLVPAALGWIEKDLIKIGHEAATARLLPLLEKAVEGLEYFSKLESSSNVSYDVIIAKKAREFLLSIRETVADASTLADASGEMKNES